jgi:hypothetical protein
MVVGGGPSIHFRFRDAALLSSQAFLSHENPSKSILAKTRVEGVKFCILQEVGIHGTITQQGLETCLTYLDVTDKV